MTIIIDQPGRLVWQVCLACRSNAVKAGVFLIDDQGIRQFRCESHATALLELVSEPTSAIALKP